MGISISLAKLLIRESIEKNWQGSILQLGKQTIGLDAATFEVLATYPDFIDGPPVMKRPESSGNKGICSPVSDIEFFKKLGFESVFSLDNNNFEGSDLVLDLNIPIPQQLHNQFDVIYDGGTIEHIFHLPQVLKNIFNMLKVGGRVIHAVPSSNHVDHGFYMFSPTLFFDFYRANRWKIEDISVFKYSSADETKPWVFYEYLPGCLDHLSSGGFTQGEMLGIWCMAKKIHSSHGDVIPQQGFYLNEWKKANQQVEIYLDYDLERKKVAIFGASELGKLAFNSVKDQADVIGFLDNDPDKKGTLFKELNVYSPDVFIREFEFDFILIASQYYDEIKQQLVELGVCCEKIGRCGRWMNQAPLRVKYKL